MEESERETENMNVESRKDKKNTSKDQRLDKIAKKMSSIWDKIEQKELQSMRKERISEEEALQEATDVDSYLAKVYTKQEEQLEDRMWDALLQGAREGNKKRKEEDKVKQKPKKVRFKEIAKINHEPIN